MSNGGYLVPPETNPSNARLWTETWKRLERFLPGLKGELFPEEVGTTPVINDPTTSPPAAAVPQQQQQEKEDPEP